MDDDDLVNFNFVFAYLALHHVVGSDDGNFDPGLAGFPFKGLPSPPSAKWSRLAKLLLSLDQRYLSIFNFHI